LSLPVTKIFQTLKKQFESATHSERLERWLPSILFTAAIFVLFYQLGAAALFEPDEGRNAEKAREILLLQDWLIPHENFHPVLDKPIFFYWLIALSYKLFGVSEWAARLPAALAALGCVVLIYNFVRRHWGGAQALWSGLILLTSVEFFILARVVIFDMPLTFFLTLALCAFYEACNCQDPTRRRVLCLLFYGALGVATLIKGLIGIVIPGMVIFFYLLLSRQWPLLRRLYLVPGIILFLVIVLPWFLQAEARHDGYLRYYFWDEHFGRFSSDDFDRSESWYYFIVVGLIGFLPWTLLVPFVIAKRRRAAFDDKTLFVVLWTALPFLFFSVSKSKLPHYILPIFPPLAVLTAAQLVDLYRESAHRARVALALTWILHGLVALYFIAGSFAPAILPGAIRNGITRIVHQLWFYGAGPVVMLALLFFWQITGRLQGWSQRFIVQTFAMVLFLVFTMQLITATASVRSAKELSRKVLATATPATQVVFYDTYLAGMAFYLRSDKPLWVITFGNKKRTFLGNYYALGKRSWPITKWGKTLMDFDEFSNQWKSSQQPMIVMVKEKNRNRLEQQIGAAPRKIAAVDEFVLLSRP
jgi:4-amino-4-deoxy-L-arabinose transferase-like glycosyltransferase